MGTPTREEIMAMNQNYTEFKFPQIKAHPWAKVLPYPPPPLSLLLSLALYLCFARSLFLSLSLSSLSLCQIYTEIKG